MKRDTHPWSFLGSRLPLLRLDQLGAKRDRNMTTSPTDRYLEVHSSHTETPSASHAMFGICNMAGSRP